MQRTVIVSNLPIDLTDEEFYNLFISKSVYPVYANMFFCSNLKDGVGIALFASKEEQMLAYDKLRDCEVDGKKIIVEIK